MDDSLSYLVYQLGGCWRRHLNGRLAETGLSHSQLLFLSGVAELAQHDRVVTQTELARHLNATRALTSEMVLLLERNGFVDRLANPSNARARVLRVTPKGQDSLGLAARVLHETEDMFLADDRDLKGRLKRDLQAALEYELREGGISSADRCHAS